MLFSWMHQIISDQHDIVCVHSIPCWESGLVGWASRSVALPLRAKQRVLDTLVSAVPPQNDVFFLSYLSGLSLHQKKALRTRGVLAALYLRCIQCSML